MMMIEQMIEDGEVVNLKLSLSDESDKRIDARYRGAEVVRRYLSGEIILEVPYACKFETHWISRLYWGLL